PSRFGWRQANGGAADRVSGSGGLAVLTLRQVLARPVLERTKRGLECPALRGQAVLDPDRRAVQHAPLDDPLGLELLEPLGQEPVGQLWHELPYAGEVERAIHQHEQDRAGPALADQLDGA